MLVEGDERLRRGVGSALGGKRMKKVVVGIV